MGPPPADMCGEQGIAPTRQALRLFLPRVFWRSCQGLDAQLPKIRGPIPPAQQQRPPAP